MLKLNCAVPRRATGARLDARRRYDYEGCQGIAINAPPDGQPEAAVVHPHAQQYGGTGRTLGPLSIS